ncbi:hypothetical protein B7463_g7928, partial [Scytalidium lignicola]
MSSWNPINCLRTFTLASGPASGSSITAAVTTPSNLAPEAPKVPRAPLAVPALPALPAHLTGVIHALAILPPL